jgi:heme exporter protein C
VPFLVFVIPRVLPSLHPSDSVVDSSGRFTMSATTAGVFFPSLIAFTGLFVWVYIIRLRLCSVERRQDEEMGR